MEISEVQCPECHEWFGFPMPPGGEADGMELDYDCEVCCRPMVIRVEDGEARAVSMDEL